MAQSMFQTSRCDFPTSMMTVIHTRSSLRLRSYGTGELVKKGQSFFAEHHDEFAAPDPRTCRHLEDMKPRTWESVPLGFERMSSSQV